MPTLRLVADDLTGALDSAARFVPLVGPVPVMRPGDDLPPVAAIDTSTREKDATAAVAIVARVAPHLGDADIAFKKIDSLLRGHVAAELAACLYQFDHCVLAPAFPYQGRITRLGRQILHGREVDTDLPAMLRSHSLSVSVLDAETDADLDAIVACGRRLSGRVLWCGTGGLAGALAGHRAVPCPELPRPILALVGSDHSVAAAQLAAAGSAMHCLSDGSAPELTALRQSLAAGAAAACVAVPPGTRRSDAAARITACFAAALAALPRFGTLFVTGGETLRCLCDSLSVRHLVVDGELEPGVPTSVLRGGNRDGQRLVSKSGAFGDSSFLTRLFCAPTAG